MIRLLRSQAKMPLSFLDCSKNVIFCKNILKKIFKTIIIKIKLWSEMKKSIFIILFFILMFANVNIGFCVDEETKLDSEFIKIDSAIEVSNPQSNDENETEYEEQDEESSEHQLFFNGIRKEIDSIVLDNDDKLFLQIDSNKPYVGSVTKFEKSVFDQNTPVYEINSKYVKSVDLSFGYQGNLNYKWGNDPYFSYYDAPATDVLLKANFQDNKTSFVFAFSPLVYDLDDNYLSKIVSYFYLKHNFTKNQAIVLGRSRMPIGYEGSQSSYTQYFIRKAQIARTYSDVKAEGVKNEGRYKYFDYSIGIFNSDRDFLSSAKGIDFAGWLNFKPLANLNGKYGDLTLGCGLNTGSRDESYSVLGAYAGYNYKKFLANIEVANANNSNGVNFLRKDSFGLYTTLGYNLTPKIQLLTRCDFFNPDKNIKNNNIIEYSTGVNYYIKKQHMRIGLNYVYIDKAQEEDSSQILFLTQFAI